MRCFGCDWEPRKDLENQRKHGVKFVVACCVFDDPHQNVVPDDGDYDEDRWIGIGRVGPVVLVVAFTERNGRERIVSARRAKRREEQAYYEAFS